MTLLYRPASLSDIDAMMEIRNNVRENRLVSMKIGREDYERAMTVDGRAWVCEDDGMVVGFACGRLAQRDIWALFIRQNYEGRGIGNALMALVERWMFDQGIDALHLTTEPGTRADRLYARRGWERGEIFSGEVRYTLRRPAH